MGLGQARPPKADPNYADEGPVWSPDGRAIAFTRRDYNYGGTKDAIFVIGSDGGGLRRLAFGHQFSWQPRD